MFGHMLEHNTPPLKVSPPMRVGAEPHAHAVVQSSPQAVSRQARQGGRKKERGREGRKGRGERDGERGRGGREEERDGEREVREGR